MSSNSSFEGGAEVDAPLKKSTEKKIVKLNGMKDVFCWTCHRINNLITCSQCPRAFHLKCSHLDKLPDKADKWVCLECDNIQRANSSPTAARTQKELEKLAKLLSLILDRLDNVDSEDYFAAPVDISKWHDYLDFVVKPMDLSTLRKNVEKKMYRSTEQFLADFRWLVHDSYVFNSVHSDYTKTAKSMLNAAKQECEEVKNCQDCYEHAHSEDPAVSFIIPCGVPHVIVWAQLGGFPYWPAKIIKRLSGEMVDVRFFGDHSRAHVPVTSCFLYSRHMPANIAKRSNKTAKMAKGIEEAEDHIKLLKAKYGTFCFAKYRIPYNSKDEETMRKLQLPGYSEPDESSDFLTNVELLRPMKMLDDKDFRSEVRCMKKNNSATKRKSGDFKLSGAIKLPKEFVMLNTPGGRQCAVVNWSGSELELSPDKLEPNGVPLPKKLPSPTNRLTKNGSLKRNPKSMRLDLAGDGTSKVQSPSSSTEICAPAKSTLSPQITASLETIMSLPVQNPKQKLNASTAQLEASDKMTSKISQEEESLKIFTPPEKVPQGHQVVPLKRKRSLQAPGKFRQLMTSKLSRRMAKNLSRNARVQMCESQEESRVSSVEINEVLLPDAPQSKAIIPGAHQVSDVECDRTHDDISEVCTLSNVQQEVNQTALLQSANNGVPMDPSKPDIERNIDSPTISSTSTDQRSSNWTPEKPGSSFMDLNGDISSYLKSVETSYIDSADEEEASYCEINYEPDDSKEMILSNNDEELTNLARTVLEDESEKPSDNEIGEEIKCKDEIVSSSPPSNVNVPTTKNAESDDHPGMESAQASCEKLNTGETAEKILDVSTEKSSKLVTIDSSAALAVMCENTPSPAQLTSFISTENNVNSSETAAVKSDDSLSSTVQTLPAVSPDLNSSTSLGPEISEKRPGSDTQTVANGIESKSATLVKDIQECSLSAQACSPRSIEISSPSRASAVAAFEESSHSIDPNGSHRQETDGMEKIPHSEKSSTSIIQFEPAAGLICDTKKKTEPPVIPNLRPVSIVNSDLENRSDSMQTSKTSDLEGLRIVQVQTISKVEKPRLKRKCSQETRGGNEISITKKAKTSESDEPASSSLKIIGSMSMISGVSQAVKSGQLTVSILPANQKKVTKSSQEAAKQATDTPVTSMPIPIIDIKTEPVEFEGAISHLAAKSESPNKLTAEGETSPQLQFRLKVKPISSLIGSSQPLRVSNTPPPALIPLNSRNSSRSSTPKNNMVPPFVPKTTFDDVRDLIRTKEKFINSRLKDDIFLRLNEVQHEYESHIDFVTSLAEGNLNDVEMTLESNKVKMYEEMKDKIREDMRALLIEARKKQWCVKCGNEANFHCCWSYSYCSDQCQKSDWPDHVEFCTQYQMDMKDPNVRPSPHFQSIIDYLSRQIPNSKVTFKHASEMAMKFRSPQSPRKYKNLGSKTSPGASACSIGTPPTISIPNLSHANLAAPFSFRQTGEPNSSEQVRLNNGKTFPVKFISPANTSVSNMGPSTSSKYYLLQQQKIAQLGKNGRTAKTATSHVVNRPLPSTSINRPISTCQPAQKPANMSNNVRNDPYSRNLSKTNGTLRIMNETELATILKRRILKL